MATTEPNKPTHEVYFVKDAPRKGQKGYWTKIGGAWAHEDQAGLNLQLELMPTDLSQGRIVIRVRSEKPADDTEPTSGEAQA